MCKKAGVLITALLFFSPFTFCQQEICSTKFIDGQQVRLMKTDDDNYQLIIDKSEFPMGKITEDSATFYKKLKQKIRNELDNLYPKEDKSIYIESFAEKFVNDVMNGTCNTNWDSKKIITELPNGYQLLSMLGKDMTYTYFLNRPADGPGSLLIIYKMSGGYYSFDLAAIEKSGLKDMAIGNFPAIIKGMKQNKEIKLPEITVVDDPDKKLYSLNFTYPAPQPGGKLEINEGQAVAIKGDTKTKQNNITTSWLKENAPTATTTTQNAPKDEAVKKDKPIATRGILVAGRNYIAELWGTNERYYMKLCGPMIVKDKKNPDTTSTLSPDTCITSEGKLISLASNDKTFKQMFNNMAGKINVEVKPDDTDFIKNEEETYAYFKSEDDKAETAKAEKEKEDNFNKLVADGVQDVVNEEVYKRPIGTITMNSGVVIHEEINFNKHGKFKKLRHQSPKTPKEKGPSKSEKSKKLSNRSNKTSTGSGPSIGIQDFENEDLSVEDPEYFPDETVRIDSVKITIDCGTIAKRGIFVFTPRGVFSNLRVPVSLLKYDKRFNDRLFNYDNRDKTHYIDLGDVLTYISLGKNYLPDDVEDLLLTPENNKVMLYGSSNFNNLINVNVYTDLAGLLGRKPNGLIQTDVSARIITNVSNMGSLDFIPVNFIEGRVSVAKFDSKFRQLDSSHVKRRTDPAKRDSVERAYLNQIPWLRGEIKLNLFRIRLGPNQLLYVNTGAEIGVVNVDSLSINGKRDGKDVIFFNYLLYPELVYTATNIGNFQLECSVKWMSQRLASSAQFANGSLETVFTPQILFSYHPARKPGSKIYLRFNYFDNQKEPESNFYQLQFGWKTTLNLSKK